MLHSMLHTFVLWVILTAPLWFVALDKRTDPWLHGLTCGLIVAVTLFVGVFWEVAC